MLSPLLILYRTPNGNDIFHQFEDYEDFKREESHLMNSFYVKGAVIKGKLFEAKSWTELDKKLKKVRIWFKEEY